MWGQIEVTCRELENKVFNFHVEVNFTKYIVDADSKPWIYANNILRRRQVAAF